MLTFLRRYDKLISVSIFLFTIALSIAVLFIPLDPDQMKAYGYGGVFLITMLGAATLFIPGPTMIAAFVVGSLLNPWQVALVAGLGSALGESTGYVAGYTSNAILTSQEARNTWYQRIFHWMGSHPFLTIFLLDAIPNFIGDLAGLIAGRMKYSYVRFLIASFLGKTVRFAISAFLGFRFGYLLSQN